MELNFLLQSLVKINNLEIFTSNNPLITSINDVVQFKCAGKIRTGKLLHIPTNKSKLNCHIFLNY